MVTTVALVAVAFAFGYLLGKGYGPLMLKIVMFPLTLARRGK
jgi:hypothetical protein